MHSYELEQQVISGLLNHPSSFNAISPFISKKDFASDGMSHKSARRQLQHADAEGVDEMDNDTAGQTYISVSDIDDLDMDACRLQLREIDSIQEKIDKGARVLKKTQLKLQRRFALQRRLTLLIRAAKKEKKAKKKQKDRE